MDEPPATTPEAAAAPAPAADDSQPLGPVGDAEQPGFRTRGRARRRARFLRKARELAYRDLGGLVFNLHRFGQRNDALVIAKLSTLSHIDAELRSLEGALGEHQPMTVLHEAGITACPRCAALHGGEDHFCPNCGLPISRRADLPIAGAPSAATASPATVDATGPTNTVGAAGPTDGVGAAGPPSDGSAGRTSTPSTPMPPKPAPAPAPAPKSAPAPAPKSAPAPAPKSAPAVGAKPVPAPRPAPASAPAPTTAPAVDARPPAAANAGGSPVEHPAAAPTPTAAPEPAPKPTPKPAPKPARKPTRTRAPGGRAPVPPPPADPVPPTTPAPEQGPAGDEQPTEILRPPRAGK